MQIERVGQTICLPIKSQLPEDMFRTLNLVTNLLCAQNKCLELVLMLKPKFLTWFWCHPDGLLHKLLNGSFMLKPKF